MMNFYRPRVLMCGGGDGGAASMRQQEEKRKQGIKAATSKINDAFAGYDDKFYGQRTNENLDYLLPQVQEQFQQTQNQLGFNLANRGLGKSSQARNYGESLGVEMGKKKQEVSNMALDASRNLRQSIEGQRANLIGMAQTASDPDSVAQAAKTGAMAFGAPSTLAPVGGLFRDWSNMFLAKQQGNLYNPATAQANNFAQSLNKGLGYGSSFGSVTSGN